MGLIVCFLHPNDSVLAQTLSQQRYIRPWPYPITPIYLIYPISFIFGQKQNLVWRGFKHKYTKYGQIWFSIVNKNELNFLNLSSRIYCGGKPHHSCGHCGRMTNTVLIRILNDRILALQFFSYFCSMLLFFYILSISIKWFYDNQI